MATTYDDVEVEAGLRVFTNDWEWGTVVRTCEQLSEVVHSYHKDEDTDCWHEVQLDSGRRAIYNKERLTTTEPRH